ncbi:MAG: phosphatase PAP2 family protein [Candidatus Yanofskybacteria bacterium]|nr:phosphatase PAP2 family protein [Candidatus Yanofskybacteria bacterium]
MVIIFGAKYLLWVLIGLVLVWFLRLPKEKQKRFILFGITALPLIYAAAKLIGLFYYNSRPFVVGDFTPLIPHEPDNGFPSDHTLLGAAMAAVTYPFSRKVSLISWGVTVLIGISRVLAGIHHPIDIAGSMAVAIFVGFLTHNLLLFFKKKAV